MSVSSKPQPKRQTPERALPVAVDTERLILGAIQLNGNRFASVAQQLHPDDFGLEYHREIFKNMLALHTRGEAIDRITVAHEIRKRDPNFGTVNGLGYLADLDTGLPEILNLEGYVTIVKRASVLRKFIRETDSLSHRAMQQEDPAMLLPAAAETIRKLQAETGQKAEAAPTVPQWPDPIHENGFHGVAGDLVRTLEPHTEADPAALLLQFLVAWGSLLQGGPYYLAEADRHHMNEYVVLVGTTSKARKGTSWGRIGGVLGAIDEYWADKRIVPGLASGEALVGAAAEHRTEEDGGGQDRRVIVLEPEFSRLLAIASREGTIMSQLLRNAWDTGRLSNRRAMQPVDVTGAHVSMIGHITGEELRRRLDDTDIANGFANRILWCCAKRSKVLPHGGGSPDLAPVIHRLETATDEARRLGDSRMSFDADARHLWEQVYEALSEGRPGLLGAITSRAEAHVVRLALIYALLDCSNQIRAVHLRAALAVWDYCYNSARFIWGNALGDPTADELLRALRASPDGLTRWDIMNHFGRNKPATEIDRAVSVLAERGLVRFEKEETGGRASTRYWAL
jgi:hypothetical protein